jgi:hypothetical protein
MGREKAENIENTGTSKDKILALDIREGCHPGV